jgi:DMSO/TMAO reductase YedYZ molybdopterin-dependent catalytic subunit
MIEWRLCNVEFVVITSWLKREHSMTNSGPNVDISRSVISRRSFLSAAAAALPAAYVAGEALADAQSVKAPAAPDPASFSGMIVRERQPENLEMPFSSLDSFITPNEKFYVRNHFKMPALSAETWRLKVEGAVEQPFEVTYEELMKMNAKTAPVTLECAGNGRVLLVPKVEGAQWQFGAVSTAEWTGIPLAALLERAVVRKTAVEVVLGGADAGEPGKPSRPKGEIHFSRSLPLAVATKGGVLLAHIMNGKPLPPLHGFPMRAVVPGWFGMASVKWLTRIVVVESPYQGYFQTVDYAYWTHRDGMPARVAVSEMLVKAQIARPAIGEVVSKGQMYRVHGAAWGTGGSAVIKVEISGDAGKTFSEAKLLGEAISGAWRLWEYQWQVPSQAGKHALMVRATDERGQSQPAERDKDRETYMINHMVPVDVETL